MNTRIAQLIEYLGIQQGRFAEQIGVTPAGVTHVLKGRNRPSLEMVMNILESFPQVSTEWLLFGRGEMFRSTAAGTSDADGGASASVARDAKEGGTPLRDVKKPVTKVIVYYDDMTYCEFHPQRDMPSL